jgi:hypothetical protein
MLAMQDTLLDPEDIQISDHVLLLIVEDEFVLLIFYWIPAAFNCFLANAMALVCCPDPL